MITAIDSTPPYAVNFNGKTWRDMPGNCEDNKKLNFWFYRRGMLDLHEDVECPDERRALLKKDTMNRVFGYKRQTAGRAMRNPDWDLTGSLGLHKIETMVIVPETADDLIEVKRRAREWATQVTGHDFTHIADVVAELVPAAEKRPLADGDKRRTRKVTDIPRGEGGRFGVICKTTIPQRIEARAAAMAAAVKLGVSLNDITLAACGTRADFLSATWLMKSDSKHYPALRDFVERVERGEVTSVPRAQNRCGVRRKETPIEERSAA